MATVTIETTSDLYTTRHNVNGGMDRDVRLTIDGRTIDGGVTLVRDPADGGWTSYGNAPDTWVSSTLLGALYCFLGDADFHAVLDEMRALAAAKPRAMSTVEIDD